MVKLLKKFLGSFGILIFVLLVLLGKMFHIRFRIGRIHTQAFGHFCEEFDMVLGKSSKDNIVDLWIPMQSISNKFLWSIFKANAITVPSLLFGPVYDVLKKYELMTFLTETNIPNYSNFPISRFENNHSSAILKNKLVKPFGFNQLKDPSRKIVVICIRDSGYDEKRPNSEEMSENIGFRNNDIRNFIPAINYLIAKGYNVVRMGRHNKEKIEISHYYDYSNDLPCSDENDFAWFNLAEFVISTGFGAEEAGALLRKRIYLVNVAPLDCLRPCLIYPFSLPLIHLKQSNNHLMKVIEIYSRGADKSYTKQQMSLTDLSVTSNSPQTIKKFIGQVVKYERDVKDSSVKITPIDLTEAKPVVSKHWINLKESAADENLLYMNIME